MRITRVRIGSFGGVRRSDQRFSEGLNVVYGPNESGKTTTAEFIRAALVHSSKRSNYPSKARTDEGTLHYTENGEEKAIDVFSKNPGRPACLSGVDDSLYRQLFAMDARTLDDADAVTKGDVKTRFLTVPGGEGVPAALKAAGEDERSTIGLKSNSPSELNRIDSEIGSLRERIAEEKEAAGEYGAVSEQIDSLRARMAELRERDAAEAEARSLAGLYEGNRGNYERLSRLKAERASIGPHAVVTDEDVETRARLREGLAAAESAAREAEAAAEDPRAAEPDPRVEARRRDIESLPGRLRAYRSDEPVKARRRTPAIIAAGVVIFAVGLVAGLLVDSTAFAIAAAGIVVAVAGAVPRRTGPAVRSPESERFERDLASLCREFGIARSTPEDEVSGLTALLSEPGPSSTGSGRLSEMRRLTAQRNRAEARSALSEFYSGFGGEQGFEDSLGLTRRASELDREISSVETAIRSAGLDPSKPECPVAPASGSAGEMNEVSARIGTLEERRRGILDMSGLESDMDRLAVLEARRAAVLREGAVAVLSRTLTQSACGASYSEVQPSVVATADRYLGAMTSGEYSMGIDPATDEIVLESGEDRKGMGRWSSGLRAQALLSVKLAIAREMGSGEIPVILDDVLLPFDSERKAGAMRALAEAASDMQILLFTCDAETRDLAFATDGASVAELVR